MGKAKNMQLIEHTINRFNGVVVTPDALPADPGEFRARLAISLRRWQADGHLVVWLNLPAALAELIPPAVAEGFSFHHSGEDYLELTYRLQPEALIPNYSTHYIGAGGVVLNGSNELLVVSEKHRRDMSRPYYKLPGGALHPREHVADAVVREVLEETGVRAQFEAVVCFRHWHGYRYGKSDIYFVCRLSALTLEISKQDDEIDECIWMPVNDYLRSEYVGDFNRRIVHTALHSAGVSHSHFDGYGQPDTHEFFFPHGLDEISG